ncbi:MAG: glycosyltransferase [Deltaproteobacteria bacterium]|nr:glycosyltransferase [Deltaproteobacteria bacterium]
MRLVFLYVADGPAPAGSGVSWNCNKTSDNFYAQRVKEEGYFYLLSKMIDTGILEYVLIIIESNRSPGRVDYTQKIIGLVMPEINDLKAWLGRDDVIWCRGGFRSWHNFLVEQAQAGRWLLIYAANTGRDKWPFWDVVFDDLAGINFVDGTGRLHLDFRKPTRPDIFYPMNLVRDYDLCIGASRIHDKKGQWRGIEVAAAYKRLYGKDLKCVLPGPWARGIKTNLIRDKIMADNLDVTVTGNLARSELARIMNRSRLFAHFGSGGQGDRGVLEALRCGCPVIISFRNYHPRWIWKNRFIWDIDDPDDYEAIAEGIHLRLKFHGNNIHRDVFDFHEKNAGVEEIILPRMARLFSLLKKHPRANRDFLKKEYGL